MKPLFVLARIILVGCLWSIVFIEGIRVIMLENWRFDIFWPAHWAYVWELWGSGWVIDTPKEWAFVLLLILFLPMWLVGWITLSLIPWEQWIEKVFKYLLALTRSAVNPIKVATKTPVVVKKKSYKEIRPKGNRAPIYDYNDSAASKSQVTPQPALKQPATAAAPMPALSMSAPSSLKEKAVNARETFSHSLFNLDDDDDDFDLDFDSFGKPEKPKKAEIIEKSAAKNNEDDDTFDIDFDLEPRVKKELKEAVIFENDDDNVEDDFVAQRPVRTSQKKDNRNDRRERDTRQNRSNREQRQEREARSNRDERAPRNDRQSLGGSEAPARAVNPIVDVLNQKGYDVLTGQTIRNTIIDFIGVAEDKICLCLVDKEAGDWLADEERFNNEEPLWFSESSHRISPVRKVDLCKKALADKLEENGLNYEIVPYVVIQMGNIINAEDMFETWADMKVEVTRINRGSPKEIKLFSKTVEEAEGRLDKQAIDTLRKIIRSVA